MERFVSVVGGGGLNLLYVEGKVNYGPWGGGLWLLWMWGTCEERDKENMVGGRGISEGGIVVFYQVLLMCSWYKIGTLGGG